MAGAATVGAAAALLVRARLGDGWCSGGRCWVAAGAVAVACGGWRGRSGAGSALAGAATVGARRRRWARHWLVRRC